jgi:hypothetical protein
MRYSESDALNEAYELIGTLYETEFQAAANSERAMTIAAALAELGEDRSWASVWWAYGAIHHDLRDEAYNRALVMLAKVDASDEARAAALMLRAEIKFTQAVQGGSEPASQEQVELLLPAANLVPDWPNLRVRLARALHAVGEDDAAREHAEAAVALAERARLSNDPFDVAFTGTGLRPGWAADELDALGLLSSG